MPDAPDPRRGALIVLEGIDGTGKSTQTAAIERHLSARGFEVVRSYEPTRGVHGARLRASFHGERLAPEAELELFVLDRRDHVARLIQPALDRGAVVVLDRYYFSTAAYQSAHGFDPEALVAQNEAFAPIPDAVFILDLHPDRALARIRARDPDGPNTFEARDALARSRDVFLALAASRPHLHVIDADTTADDLSRVLCARLDALLEARDAALTPPRTA